MRRGSGMRAAVATLALSIFRGSFIYFELSLDMLPPPTSLPRGAAWTAGHSVGVSMV